MKIRIKNTDRLMKETKEFDEMLEAYDKSPIPTIKIYIASLYIPWVVIVITVLNLVITGMENDILKSVVLFLWILDVLIFIKYRNCRNFKSSDMISITDIINYIEEHGPLGNGFMMDIYEEGCNAIQSVGMTIDEFYVKFLNDKSIKETCMPFIKSKKYFRKEKAHIYKAYMYQYLTDYMHVDEDEAVNRIYMTCGPRTLFISDMVLIWVLMREQKLTDEAQKLNDENRDLLKILTENDIPSQFYKDLYYKEVDPDHKTDVPGKTNMDLAWFAIHKRDEYIARIKRNNEKIDRLLAIRKGELNCINKLKEEEGE